MDDSMPAIRGYILINLGQSART